jgi:hypothetical protein
MKMIFLVLSVLFSAEAFAQYKDNGYFYRAAAQREEKRWTLQEWLETKDRNRMMDLWLALYSSPNPYEAMLGGAYKSSTTEVDNPTSQNQTTSGDGYVTAHASIVGITGEYENNVQDKYRDINGMLNLRIFGNSLQNTFLTLHYGQRTRTLEGTATDTDYKNQFGQVSLQLYLMKYFGLDGSYRKYVPATEEKLNQEIWGDLSEAGVFIDFKAVRVFGSWYRDYQVIKSTTGTFDETDTLRFGTKTGIKIFF